MAKTWHSFLLRAVPTLISPLETNLELISKRSEKINGKLKANNSRNTETKFSEANNFGALRADTWWTAYHQGKRIITSLKNIFIITTMIEYFVILSIHIESHNGQS